MANWFDSVPAPLDANGCVVPLDTKKLVYRGETREVYGFRFDCSARRGRWNWCAVFENSDVIRLSACTMPDSWERLLKDLERPTESGDKFCSVACAYVNNSGNTCGDCKLLESCGLCTKGMLDTRGLLEDIASRIRKLRGDAE